MIWRIRCLVVPILLLFSQAAHAVTYYVSTTGSDTNNGTAIETPFRTIAKAVTTMVPGDTTFVRGGTYEEGLIRFRTPGTQTSPIKLLNYPGERPVIDFINPLSPAFHHLRVEHASGSNRAMGWLTISGFELTGGHDGIKFHNLHNSTISHMYIHDNNNQGILGIGGHHNVFDKNIISHNGGFADCAALGTNEACNLEHGLYMHGDAYTLTNNLIYDNLAFGIQQNGSASSNFSATLHPSAEFAGAKNWMIVNNTFAYQYNASAMVLWGGAASATIDNNIIYENRVTKPTTEPNAFRFVGTTASNQSTIRNNHIYASGSGGQAFQTGGVEGSDYVQSGNVLNVSPPGFVNGGNNALPVSPDWSLTAGGPAIGMARVTAFPRNPSLTVGAFDTVGMPTASITLNKITLIFPMSNAVPIQNLSTAGVSISCPATVCPGTPVISSVSPAPTTDTHVEITLAGITNNACLSHTDQVTVSYNSAAPGASWTGNDNIGPWPGLHQKIFSFTNLAVTNQCTGSGPPPPPSGPHIHYDFNDGTGVTANDLSPNNLDCTLMNGAGWGAGKTGTGLTIAAGTQQHCAVPWGNGVNPSTQSLTIFIPVFIKAGQENGLHFIGASGIGTNQRGYPCAHNGTWKIAIQGTNCTSTPASNLTVTSGWNVLTLRFDSTADVATLYKGSLAGTGGASRSYTSYTFAENWKIGQLTGNSINGDYVFDEFRVYLSLEDPAALSTAFDTAPPAPAGTLAQAAIQFQEVYLRSAGASPTNIGALNSPVNVVRNGAVAVVVQLHCQNVANCDPTAFKATYRKNGSSTRVQIPNAQTTDGIWMWGSTTEALLNAGVTTSRLTGTCAVTNGVTLLTAEQIPNVDLPQDGCVMLRLIANVGDAAVVGDYFDLGFQTEAGLNLPGGYAAEARINVIGSQASAGP